MEAAPFLCAAYFHRSPNELFKYEYSCLSSERGLTAGNICAI